MQTQDFNIESQPALFAYQPSPVNARAFLITKSGQSEPVGDYTVLDLEEDLTLSEKKVMNLISLLNGRQRLMELGHETQSRVLYQVINEEDEENKTNVLFYQLGAQGISKENALFRLERNEHEL